MPRMAQESPKKGLFSIGVLNYIKHIIGNLVAYLTSVNTVFCVTHPYANGIHARDEYT